MRLGVISGPHAGSVVKVDGALTVGRSHECALTLNDPKVSRRHATLSSDGTGLALRDDKSLNGTWLNDRRIAAPSALAVGDRVRIGSSEFVVLADEDPFGHGELTERDLEQLLGAADGRTLIATGATT
jgi:pSer/pThr/pTyr-binding forkhead associated (FHA) protein